MNKHKIAPEIQDMISMVKEYTRPGEGPSPIITDRMNQFFSEGRAADRGFTAEDANPQELQRGIEVEMEHTTDPRIAQKIALDHLAEFPNYYTLLDAMESHARDKQNDY